MNTRLMGVSKPPSCKLKRPGTFMLPTKKEKKLALIGLNLEIANLLVKSVQIKTPWETVPLYIAMRSLLARKMAIRSTRTRPDHEAIDAEIMLFMTRRKMIPKHKIIALMIRGARK